MQRPAQLSTNPLTQRQRIFDSVGMDVHLSERSAGCRVEPKDAVCPTVSAVAGPRRPSGRMAWSGRRSPPGIAQAAYESKRPSPGASIRCGWRLSHERARLAHRALGESMTGKPKGGCTSNGSPSVTTPVRDFDDDPEHVRRSSYLSFPE
jgi:hypothetical protein